MNNLIDRRYLNPSLVVGSVIVGAVVVVSLLGPLIVGRDPYEQDVARRLAPPVGFGGSWDHPLGTDGLGRDVLARLVYGARMSLTIAVASVALSSLLGLALGMLSGYYGGWVDGVIMGVAETQMCFPFIVMAIIMMAFLEPSPGNIVVAFVVAGWPTYTKVIRGVVLGLKEEEFVDAARAIGCSDSRIIIRHLLPNVVAYLSVLAALQLCVVVFTEAGLSFVGIGVQPPTPSWGVMLGEGRDYMSTAWWLASVPGFALMVTALGANLLSDGLRDAIDPYRLR